MDGTYSIDLEIGEVVVEAYWETLTLLGMIVRGRVQTHHIGT